MSLFRGNVWDGTVLENTRLESNRAYRLVGVNGIPIKVQETVLVKVSIKSLTFNQKFLILEGITAEYIIGYGLLRGK